MLLETYRRLCRTRPDQSADFGECTDPENFVSDHIEEIQLEFDEFDGFKNRIKKFEHDWKIFEKDSNDSFYFAILYTIYALQDKEEDFDFCQDRDKVIQVFGRNFLRSLKQRRKVYV